MRVKGRDVVEKIVGFPQYRPSPAARSSTLHDLVARWPVAVDSASQIEHLKIEIVSGRKYGYNRTCVPKTKRRS
jgi:hypothetical protein